MHSYNRMQAILIELSPSTSCLGPDNMCFSTGRHSRQCCANMRMPSALLPTGFVLHIITNRMHSMSRIYLKACAQRFRYALFAFIHTQTYFEYHTLTLRLASLVKRAVIYAYWTKELFDICRENVSHMATLPSVARHVIHADNLGPHH